MPKISVAVPHALGQEQVVEKLKGLMPNVTKSYQVTNLEENWVGNVLNFAFTTFGMQIKGALQVEPNEVKLDGEIPFAAMMFKGKIEQEFKDSLTKLLA